MKTLHTKTHIGPGGALNLALVVPDMADRDVDVAVVLSLVNPNGAKAPNGVSAQSRFAADAESEAGLGPRPTPEERRRRLDKAIGSIDDPTFQRPPQGEFEVREPLD